MSGPILAYIKAITHARCDPGEAPMKHLFTFAIVCILLMPAMGQADFESDVFDLVNDERAAQGLDPLGYNTCLADAARDHSEDMGVNEYFSHTSQDGRSPGDRIAAAGYAWLAYGENIAAGYPTPQAVMEGWMNSDGHRANILDPDLCDIGVGYAYVSASTYGHYWTQNFGCKSADDPCPVTETSTVTTGQSPPGTSADPAPPVQEGETVTAAGNSSGGGGCFIPTLLGSPVHLLFE